MSCKKLIILPFISGDVDAELHLIIPRVERTDESENKRSDASENNSVIKDQVFIIGKEGAILDFSSCPIEFDKKHKGEPNFVDDMKMFAYDRTVVSKRYFQVWIGYNVPVDNDGTVTFTIVEDGPCVCFHCYCTKEVVTVTADTKEQDTIESNSNFVTESKVDGNTFVQAKATESLTYYNLILSWVEAKGKAEKPPSEKTVEKAKNVIIDWIRDVKSPIGKRSLSRIIEEFISRFTNQCTIICAINELYKEGKVKIVQDCGVVGNFETSGYMNWTDFTRASSIWVEYVKYPKKNC